MNARSTVLHVPEAQENRARWAWHLGGLVILFLVIAGVFWRDISSAAQVWWVYPAFSHCFLIIPICLWLIWDKRDDLRAQMPALAPKAVLGALPFLALWLVGEFSTINEARQIAVVGFVQVAIATMLGMRVYRMILFPALYLFFLVPTGQYLIPPLQRFTTHFVDVALGVVGIPHYTEGTLIELANGRFEIAEACAGLRFLIATVALGTLFAHLVYSKWKKIILFLATCVVVPIIGNGLRAFGIVLLAHFTDNKVAVGADHLIYGWGFSVAIMLLLFFVGLRFRDPPATPVSAKSNGTPPSRTAIFTLAAMTAVTIMLGPALAYWRDSRPIIANTTALARPLAPRGWESVPTQGMWRPDYNGTDAELRVSLLQTQDRAASPVDLAVEYFGRMRGGHKLVASTNKPWDDMIWRPLGVNEVTARFGQVPVAFSETLIVSSSGQRLVWSSYWLDGRFTRNEATVRLLQLEAALVGKEGAALVAISTPVESTIDEARERLTAAAAALGELPARLSQAGETPNAQTPQ